MDVINPNDYLGPEIGVFTLLTIIYAIIKYKLPDFKFVFPIYLILILFGQIWFSISITSGLCGSPQGYTVLFSIVPWVVIFNILQLMLIVFPGWLSPFSNTIGYAVVYSKVSKILIDVPSAINTFSDVQVDFSKLIDKEPIDDDATKTLNACIRLKNIISESIWCLLAGILTISASFQSIVSAPCQRTVAQMTDANNAYMDNVATEQANAKLNKPKVYTVTD